MGIHHGAILRILRDDGPQSRAELARRTSLSPTTLTHLTAQLIKQGTVTELAQASGAGGVGRPAVDLALVPESQFVIGMHLSRGSIQATLTDLKALPRATVSLRFNGTESQTADVRRKIAKALSTLAENAAIDVSRIVGVGLCVPGPVDSARRRNLQPVSEGWIDVPLVGELEAMLGLPVVLEHNVSAMALAEARYGMGRDARALLYIYLRAGIGAGFVVDGMPFRPGGDGAIELGHIQVAEHGELCSCGNVGCLETFLSERSLARVAGLRKPYPASLFSALDSKGEAWASAMRHLTTAIATATNLLHPDLVVFGGHLAEAPDTFLGGIRTGVPPRVLPPMRDTLRFERTSLGAEAGAIGGAAAALDRLFYSGVPA